VPGRSSTASNQPPKAGFNRTSPAKQKPATGLWAATASAQARPAESNIDKFTALLNQKQKNPVAPEPEPEAPHAAAVGSGAELRRQAIESGLSFGDIRGKSDGEIRALMQEPVQGRWGGAGAASVLGLLRSDEVVPADAAAARRPTTPNAPQQRRSVSSPERPTPGADDVRSARSVPVPHICLAVCHPPAFAGCSRQLGTYI
jgi:hypothetical protein